MGEYFQMPQNADICSYSEIKMLTSLRTYDKSYILFSVSNKCESISISSFSCHPNLAHMTKLLKPTSKVSFSCGIWLEKKNKKKCCNYFIGKISLRKLCIRPKIIFCPTSFPTQNR